MTNDWIFTFILAGAFLLLFGVAELLYHFAKVKAELTRKLVHLGTGILTLLFPILLDNQWLVLLLCSSFVILLVASLKYKLLPSINAIDRFSVGSLAYPVSVYCCYLLFDKEGQDFQYFYVPILILAICDPIAALMGKRWPKGKFSVGKETKTLMGSSMFLISALLVYCTLTACLQPHTSILMLVWRGLIVASITCIAEAVSGKGTDNLTIPAAALMALYITNYA